MTGSLNDNQKRINMRKLITACFFALFIFLNMGCHKTKGCMNPYSFNYNPDAERDDGSCKDMAGCLGYTTGFTNSGTIGNSLGDPFWDNKMSQEVYIQRNCFNGIPANVYILYEPSAQMKNAYATPDGNILFGYFMHYYTIQAYGELPVAGILAHEWGQRTQFTAGWQDYNKVSYKELEADAFSGFYMALAKQFAWSQIQSYYANVYASGDYNFNSPQHHGTPNQRLQAAYLGVQTAVSAMQTNTRYSYNQLHGIFINQISTKIAPRLMTNKFEEVQYPKLSKDQIEKLYPRMDKSLK
jgi:hypothetical protein